MQQRYNRDRGRDSVKCVEPKWVGGICGQHGSYVFSKAFSYDIRVPEKEEPSLTTVNSASGEKRPLKNGQYCKRILAVGDFFFLRYRKEDPICIGEIQLLWSDKSSDQDLSSTRLYYIPETTPAGRTSQHGKDEVIAASEKVVMRTADLVSLIVEPEEWDYGCNFADGQGSIEDSRLSPIRRIDRLFNGMDMKEIDDEKKQLRTQNDLRFANGSSRAIVRVLSMQSYNRYKALLKRFEGLDKGWMKRHGKLLTALGLHVSSNPRARIVFCRSFFEYPLLLEHEFVRDELGPIFKGRPRKKLKRTSSNCKTLNVKNILPDARRTSARQKSKRKKTYEMFNLEDYIPAKKSRLSSHSKEYLITRAMHKTGPKESRSSEDEKQHKDDDQVNTKKGPRRPLKLIIKRDSDDKGNSAFSTGPGNEVSSSESESIPSSSCSSISNSYQRNENQGSRANTPSSSSSVSPSSPAPAFPTHSNAVAPCSTDTFTVNEINFHARLFDFMRNRKTPIGKIPSLGFRKLNLWELFKLSQAFGGYEMVTTKRLWKHIYDRMGGNPSSTSAATTTRKHYEKLLLPFETHVNELIRQASLKSVSAAFIAQPLSRDAIDLNVGKEAPTPEETVARKSEELHNSSENYETLERWRGSQEQGIRMNMLSTKIEKSNKIEENPTEIEQIASEKDQIHDNSNSCEKPVAETPVDFQRNPNILSRPSVIIPRAPLTYTYLGGSRPHIPKKLHCPRYSRAPPPHIPKRHPSKISSPSTVVPSQDKNPGLSPIVPATDASGFRLRKTENRRPDSRDELGRNETNLPNLIRQGAGVFHKTLVHKEDRVGIGRIPDNSRRPAQPYHTRDGHSPQRVEVATNRIGSNDAHFSGKLESKFNKRQHATISPRIEFSPPPAKRPHPPTRVSPPLVKDNLRDDRLQDQVRRLPRGNGYTRHSIPSLIANGSESHKNMWNFANHGISNYRGPEPANFLHSRFPEQSVFRTEPGISAAFNSPILRGLSQDFLKRKHADVSPRLNFPLSSPSPGNPRQIADFYRDLVTLGSYSGLPNGVPSHPLGTDLLRMNYGMRVSDSNS